MNGVVVRETVRRHLTHVGYLATLALIAMSGLAASQAMFPGSLWPSLVSLLAVVTGCAIIGPEFSSGTLQLILVKPVNRSVYLLSRVAGVLLVVWLAAFTGAAFETIARTFRGEFHTVNLLLSALANSMAEALLIVALLTLLGSITRAYFNVAIFYGLQIAFAIGISVLRMMQRVPAAIPNALAVIDHNLFPDVGPRFDPGLMLLLMTNAAVALLLACVAFNQREVPYGAD